MMQRLGASLLLVAAFLLAGCTSDAGPLAPDSELEGEDVRAAVSCRVELERGTMVCSPVEPSVPAGLAGAVFGGQNRYVQLESSDVRYVDNIFSADVSVRNLITQPIGTLDSTNLERNGVRVFFHSDPMVTEGSGAVEVRVRNADGYGSFTATDQPYFRYDQILSPGRRSLPKRWEWTVSGSVQAFAFTVFVQAAVPDEEAIAPGLHLDVRTVAIGEYHACALTITGKAYCWGTNRDGQLGDGSNDDSAAPVAVRVPAGERFTVITAGAMHTCAITLDGAAYCWGQNARYQLGNGTASSANEPTPIDVPAGEEFISISAGPKTSCAVAAGGSAYCWGFNWGYKIGYGTSNTVRSSPVRAQMPSGTEFVQVSAGWEHTCAIAAGTGSAYCWGDNAAGRLGTGTSNFARIPSLVQMPEGVSFERISAGGVHVCALSTANEVYCWGAGMIGNGGTAGSTRPIRVEPQPGLLLFD